MREPFFLIETLSLLQANGQVFKDQPGLFFCVFSHLNLITISLLKLNLGWRKRLCLVCSHANPPPRTPEPDWWRRCSRTRNREPSVPPRVLMNVELVTKCEPRGPLVIFTRDLVLEECKCAWLSGEHLVLFSQGFGKNNRTSTNRCLLSPVWYMNPAGLLSTDTFLWYICTFTASYNIAFA